MVIEEVSEDTLECYNYYRSLHLVHPSFEEVSACSLEVFVGAWE